MSFPVDTSMRSLPFKRSPESSCYPNTSSLPEYSKSRASPSAAYLSSALRKLAKLLRTALLSCSCSVSVRFSPLPFSAGLFSVVSVVSAGLPCFLTDLSDGWETSWLSVAAAAAIGDGERAVASPSTVLTTISVDDYLSRIDLGFFSFSFSFSRG